MNRHKYEAKGIQSEFQPGSRNRVLRNSLGITRMRDMNEAESQALELAQRSAIDRFDAEHRFTASIFAGYTGFGWGRSMGGRVSIAASMSARADSSLRMRR